MAPARPMNLPEAAAAVLWRDWLRTGRRASRSEFWLGALGCLLLSVAWFLALGAIVPERPAALLEPGWMLRHPLPGLLNLVFAVWINVAMLTVSVRRLHDAGRSGLWLLVGWPPYAGLQVLDWFGSPALALPLLLWWLAGGLVLVVMLAAAPSPLDNRWGPAWRPGLQPRGPAHAAAGTGHGAPPGWLPVPAAREPARILDPPVERLRSAARRPAFPRARRRPPAPPRARAPATGGGGLEGEFRAARTRRARGALAAAAGLAAVAALCAAAYGLGLLLGAELPFGGRERSAAPAGPGPLVAEAEAAAARDDWAGAMELFGEAAALGSARAAEGERLAREVLAWHRSVLDALEGGAAAASAGTVEDGMAAAALSPAAAEDLRKLRAALGEDAWRSLAGPGS